MKRKVIFVSVLMCLLSGNSLYSQKLVYVAEGLQEEKSDPLEQRITLDFHNIDIVEALKFLSTKAHLNIIPTTRVKGRITLMVEDAPIKDVFDIMLRSNNLAYDKRGEIYNIMTAEEYRELYGKNFSDVRQVAIFKLKYIIPEQAFSLCDTLKSDLGKVLLNPDSGSIVVLDTPEHLQEIKAAIESLENKNIAIKIFDLKYANAKDIANELKEQLNLKKVGSIKADERTNQVIVQTLPERLKDIEKLIKGLDLKTKEVLVEVRIVKITFTDSLSKGVEWEGLFDIAGRYGGAYIGNYPFSAVQESGDAWRSRKAVWEGGFTADGTWVPGTDYVGSYPFSGTITSGDNFGSGGKSTAAEKMHVGMIGKHDFDVIFKYLRTFGELKVVACPQLTVINNQEAKIHIGEKQA
ncbi:MAG: hypothetical protein JSW40_10215, partial [Candidatus Omnitrophota bacterium]